MDEKIEQTKKIKCLEKALTLLKYNKEIINCSCNRSFSKDYRESINLSIEFEIPDNLVVDSDTPSSFYSDSSYTTISNTSRKDNSKVYASTETPFSETSSLLSESCDKNDTFDSNENYQALNTIILPNKSTFVEVKVYVRTYVQGKEDNGILEKYDLELNPFKTTPKEIIKTILPNKDPLKVIKDGVYFTRDDFDASKNYTKNQNWIICYPYELDMPLVTIYGSTIINDFKLSFVIDNINKK